MWVYQKGNDSYLAEEYTLNVFRFKKDETRDQSYLAGNYIVIETSIEYFIENLYDFNGIKLLMQLVLQKHIPEFINNVLIIYS